jgi:hypothetical protein
MKSLNKKKIYIIIAIVVAASVVVEALFAHPHGHNFWHTTPGFDIVMGFVGGWVLILFAKQLLGPLLQRDEDYYDGGDGDE